jgi:hypothetical protein
MVGWLEVAIVLLGAQGDFITIQMFIIIVLFLAVGYGYIFVKAYK